MRKIFAILLCCGLSWSISACSEDKSVNSDTPEIPVIKIGQDENLAPVCTSDGEKLDFHFTATSSWTASVMNTRADSWLSVEPLSGEAGTITLTITLLPNDSYDERNATIQIKCGDDVKNIVVTQKQKNALMLSASRCEVSQQGGTVDIEVRSNVSYTTEIPAQYKEWIEAAPASRALETSALSFSVAANMELEPREGEIIIQENDGSLSEVLHVYQFGGPVIVISQREYTVPSEGGTVQVEIESNTEYEALPPEEEWIRENAKRSVSTHTRYYTVDANETYDARMAKLVFRTTDGSLLDTVTVKQVQKGALAITPSSCNIGGSGGKVTFDVNTNEKYEVEIPSDVNWVHRLETRALTTETLTLSVDTNTSATPRKATVTLRSETLTGTLTINQGGFVDIRFSTDTIRATSAAVTKEFTLTANANWTLQSNNENWCTVSPIQGSAGTYTAKVSLTENTSMFDARTAYLTLTIDTTARHVVVVQDHATPDPNISKGIRNLDDLINFRDAINEGKDISMWKYNGEINLLADIDLSYVENWEPIGSRTSSKVNKPFTGIFNGNGYTIRNLKINSNASTIGFFGYNSGIIKNLRLENVDIKSTKTSTTDNHVGGICGWNFIGDGNANGKIVNCIISGKIVAPEANSGGICGYNQGSVNDCTTDGIVTGYYVGGICGNNQKNISACINKAAVFSSKYSGGICGDNSGDISDCIHSGFLFKVGKSFLIGTGKDAQNCSDNQEQGVDEKFYKVLKFQLSDDPLDVKELDIPKYDTISSLHGIEYFQNLEKLIVRGTTNLNTLDLSHNKELTYLSISNYKGDVLNLSENTKLNYLQISAYSLKEFDFNTLPTSLTFLGFNSHIGNIDLSNRLNLSEINIRGKSGVSTLNLTGCSNLYKVDCEGFFTLNTNGCTKLKKLECSDLNNLDLTDCEQLDSLTVTHSNISSLDLNQHPTLTYLWCFNNHKLVDINISRCTNLKSLYCLENQLTSLDVNGCTSLSSLNCSENQLTSLDVNGCTSLSSLNCSENQLTSLDVNGCINLKSLECNSNQLTSLDVNGCTSLGSLNCSENQLTSLDVNGCINLKSLECNSNQLTSLDVNGCTSLSSLNCSKNQLTSLDDVSGCTNLSSLSCSENQLTSLDVNGYINLRYLECNSNQLTSLDVNRCTSLGSLECNSNQLTSLEVNGCINLRYLECNSNQLTSLEVCASLFSLECNSNQLTSLDVCKCSFREFMMGSWKYRYGFLCCTQNPLETLYLSTGQRFETLEYPMSTQVIRK